MGGAGSYERGFFALPVAPFSALGLEEGLFSQICHRPTLYSGQRWVSPRVTQGHVARKGAKIPPISFQ